MDDMLFGKKKPTAKKETPVKDSPPKSRYFQPATSVRSTSGVEMGCLLS